MKIEFADSFFESLERLSKYDRWYNVLWRVVRYNIPNFFKNIWYFKKELYDFEAWDYRFNLDLFQRSLEATADYLEHSGIEINESRMKKVAKMRRVIELLKKDREGNWVEEAEAELGALQNDEWTTHRYRESTPEEKEHNSNVFLRANELEKQDWDELWDIIKGKESTSYEDHDGSNMKSWWD